MRLHLPKALLAAVLAACLAWPAGATDYTASCSANGTEIKCSSDGGTTKVALTDPTAQDTITFDVSAGYLFDATSGTAEEHTIAANLVITQLNMTNGYSGRGTTAWYYFTGSVSGSGEITRTAAQESQGFSFSGGMSEYSGNITINGKGGGPAEGKDYDNILKLGAIQVGKSGAAGSITINANSKLQLAGTTIWGNVTSVKTEIGEGNTTFHGNLTNTGTLTNNGTLTISGSYTGGTITQGDGASLTLASGSVVNMGGMTANFGTGRDSSPSGLQSYTASYTIADGGTTTGNDAVFRVGGEKFTGTLSNGVYTITESRYNILAGECKSIQDVEGDIGDSADSYYINVIGSTTEGIADGTLTGVSDDTLTHGIIGNGIIQVDAGTSLSYSTIADKASDFTGTIVLAGSDLILDGNGVTFSRDLSVTDDSSLKLSGSTSLSGAITATANKVLSVSLADGATSGTLKLNGTTGKLSGAKLQIENGVNVSVDGRSNGTAYIRGDITVNAGGTLTLNGKDALGYNGGQTLSITLAGSATDGYATLDLGTTEQTMQTALNLNGYAKITGTGNGSFNSWSNVASGNTDTFSKITVSRDHNEITCGVLVRQGLEVSVSENSSLEIRGTVSPKESGQSNAGFKKTGEGLLTITGNTSMNKQLQVEAGTMKISGTTNGLSGAVAVSTGATLEFAGGSTTISSVVSGGGVIKVSGGTVTLNANNTYTNETRLSGGEIQAGHANAFGTGKLIVDGTGSISGTATIADFIGLESGSKLTIKENSAITLSNTGNNKGIWVKSGASVVLESGASVTGYGVTVSHLNENSKLAAEGSYEGQFGACGQLFEDKLTIKESAISLAGTAVLRNKLDGGTVSSTGNTTIGWLDENGTHGGGSISSLADTSVSDTLKVASDLAVTKSAAIAGTLNIGEKATTAINSAREGDTASSIGTLIGSGTLKTTGGTTEVTNASGFSGTLAATGGDIELQSATALALSEVVVSGGSSITVVDTVSDVLSISASKVSIGEEGGSLVGSLSINSNGTITLDASAGEAGTGLNLGGGDAVTQAEGAITTGTLTLGTGLTLNLLNLDLKREQSLTLFSGITSAVYGDAATALTADGIEAKNVFSNLTEGDFKLSYSNNIVALVAQRDVPEPTTATLSLLALMGLAARRRRRKA